MAKVNACGPLGYKGSPDALYRNNVDGAFTDVTAKAGVADRNLYYGFQAVFEDFDNDGHPDLFLAKDSNPNYLYRNKGDGTFAEVGVPAGVAYSGDGKEMSSMGVAVAPATFPQLRLPGELQCRRTDGTWQRKPD